MYSAGHFLQTFSRRGALTQRCLPSKISPTHHMHFTDDFRILTTGWPQRCVTFNVEFEKACSKLVISRHFFRNKGSTWIPKTRSCHSVNTALCGRVLGSPKPTTDAKPSFYRSDAYLRLRTCWRGPHKECIHNLFGSRHTMRFRSSFRWQPTSSTTWCHSYQPVCPLWIATSLRCRASHTTARSTLQRHYAISLEFSSWLVTLVDSKCLSFRLSTELELLGLAQFSKIQQNLESFGLAFTLKRRNRSKDKN
jgi:hypothetical protein